MSLRMEYDAERLIYLVENRPPIYNVFLKEHNNRKLLDQLWEEIAIEMKSSVNECKHKWSNLRNSYARSLRERRTENFDTNCRKRKIWYLENSMSFMEKFMTQHNRSLKNMKREYYNNVDLNDNNNTTRSPISNDENYTEKDENPVEIKYNSSPIPEQISRYPNIGIATTTTTTNNENILAPESMMQILPTVSIPTTTSSTMTTSSTTKIKQIHENDYESNLMFMKSLLPDLRKLSERRQRIFKQNVLLNLNQLLEEQENESSNQKMY